MYSALTGYCLTRPTFTRAHCTESFYKLSYYSAASDVHAVCFLGSTLMVEPLAAEQRKIVR